MTDLAQQIASVRTFLESEGCRPGGNMLTAMDAIEAYINLFQDEHYDCLPRDIYNTATDALRARVERLEGALRQLHLLCAWPLSDAETRTAVLRAAVVLAEGT